MLIEKARRLLVGTAAGVVVLSGAGCSGQDAGQDAGKGFGARAGGALTYEALRSLAFKDGEVPNTHDTPVEEPAPKKSERTFPPVSDASCQSVLDVLEAKGASAVVRQVFNWKDDLWGGGSTLASYRGEGAEQAFDRLEEGLQTCRSYSGESYEGAYTTEVTGVGAPQVGQVGDEALTFRTVTPTKDGLVMHQDHVFVRTGKVTATFRKAEAGHEGTFPRDLVQRQVDRLAEAQGS
ncbi:hypothetical protein [Streptomyces aurantiogriseus]|uniref:Lipoprotein n=1 Tax=Streptomyces aurantiogriseus TaxID=66870 RepID=A0A918CNL5_9ACTN|nr:hypothetical protein [Streptomyces aurantiogriseus]GGR30510.1 hypothetical protein GCM10010251_53160 [Streptomyces aurantiogriseus]